LLIFSPRGLTHTTPSRPHAPTRAFTGLFFLEKMAEAVNALEQNLLKNFRKEIVHAVLFLAVAPSYLRISGAAWEGGDVQCSGS
jgi:hypothetical protein